MQSSRRVTRYPVVHGAAVRVASRAARSPPSSPGRDDRVVKRRTHLQDRVVRGGRVDAVGQQHHVQAALPIDPQRRAGVARVTDCRRATSASRTTRSASSCPSRARACCWEYRSCAARTSAIVSGFASESSPCVSAAQHEPREAADGGRRAEQAGVTRFATERPAVRDRALRRSAVARASVSISVGAMCGRRERGG